MTFARAITMTAIFAGALALSACAESRMHLSDDFGRAFKEDTLGQIADPDAKYTGNPAPGSNGTRVAAAQDRYVNGKVTPPVAARTSTVGGTSGSSGGGSQ